MFETQLSARIIDAQSRAHKERADAFARLFRAIPNLVSSIRHGR